MKRPKSMADIASLAKVSMPTVSRALRNSPLVKEKTRAHIQAIAARHGYAVNRNAQRLRGRRVNAIAVVADFTSLSPNRLYDHFAYELLADIRRALALRNLDLLLCSPAVDQRRAYRYIVASRHADGLIFLGQGLRDSYLRALASTDTPFVVWGAAGGDQPYCAVGSDNLRGGELVGERFTFLGRRRPLLVGVDDAQLEMQSRRQGFEDALRAHSPAIRPDRLVLRDLSFDAICTELEGKLDSMPALPDSIFAACDTFAMAVYAVLGRRGMRIPDDVSVIGYNDEPYAAWCSPALTTVRQDTRYAGSLLVEQLMCILEGGRPRSIVLPAELVTRES